MTKLLDKTYWRSASAFEARARACLLPHPPAITGADDDYPAHGDHVMNPGQLPPEYALNARAAAVLVPVVAHKDRATVLLTQRASHLRDHAGQIAFPGGKIDSTDNGPLGAALREAEEEIGLGQNYIAPVGYLPPYLTGSGFRILPVVAIVAPGFSLRVNHMEVDDAFEVPLEYLMDAANHEKESREWKGMMRHYYTILFEGRNIWGVTAGIVRQLFDRMEMQ
ncbi:MAG: CoA pyrophosphatase [Beijerinckiaceae bacterium]